MAMKEEGNVGICRAKKAYGTVSTGAPLRHNEKTSPHWFLIFPLSEKWIVKAKRSMDRPFSFWFALSLPLKIVFSHDSFNFFYFILCI